MILRRLKAWIREAVDRRAMYLLTQHAGTLAEAHLRAELDAMRRGAGSPLAGPGWDGTGDPFAYHTAAAVSALSQGVAALYGFDVDGDLAEFGTMTGATACGVARAMASCDRHMAHAVQVYGSARRTLHLFDSFAGLPATSNPIDADAPHVRDGAWMPGACRGLSAEELRAAVCAFLPEDRVRVHAGWFSETVPALPAETRFALIHIDSDLYVSAMDALAGLFSRGLVARGAYVFFDDWSTNAARPELGERRAWHECVERFGIVASDQGRYGIFARCFTVHDYRPETEAV
jgi:Macrocin-O-methyltransferase (TylF)